ncbi:hypothetical protein EVAR_30638_1 [Eumeta japonica]|uniref:Uncharacterized protein n=1 Tax=Eumeta variegata TaxID=151549 RepID=A0A4C1VRP5_EUMVA|nr:hypothetical protein EVAR_30638_1 [Eumeta japonica]
MKATLRLSDLCGRLQIIRRRRMSAFYNLQLFTRRAGVFELCCCTTRSCVPVRKKEKNKRKLHAIGSHLGDPVVKIELQAALGARIGLG